MLLSILLISSSRVPAIHVLGFATILYFVILMLELKRSASTGHFEDFANVGICPINAQASDKQVARNNDHIQFKASLGTISYLQI